MNKFCIVLLNSDNPSAINKTIKSLTQTFGTKEACIVMVFDKMIYELDSRTLKIIDNISLKNIKCFFNVKQNDSINQIIEEILNSEYFFIMNEGDSIDHNYLLYIDYFFNDNKNQCSVLTLPVKTYNHEQLTEEFSTLPTNGIRHLTSESLSSNTLPLSIKGVVMLSNLLESIPFESCNFNDIFFEVMLKGILHTKCYGIINTVCYYSDVKSQNNINAKLLKNLTEFCIEFYSEVPFFFSKIIEDFAEKHLLSSKDHFDNDILEPQTYTQSLFTTSEDTSFSLYISDIRNRYTDVEISGVFSCPLNMIEKKLMVTLPDGEIIEHHEESKSPNNVLQTQTESYKQNSSSQFKQKISFNAVLKLNHGTAAVRFGIHTPNGIENLNAIELPNEVKETNRINNYNVFQINDSIHIEKIAPRANYKVSCIIPVHNAEKYLKEAIESVISQSIGFFSNIQILLINNKSTDNSENICLEFAKKYPSNISYYYQEEQGVSKARNLGLLHAIGDYISFLDADDKLPQKYLESGINFLEKNYELIDMVAFPLEYFGENNQLPKPSLNFRFDKTTIIDTEINFQYIQFSACSVLIKRDALTKKFFNEQLDYSEDAEFVHKIILEKMKYGIIQEPSYLYRIRQDGSSATQSKEHQISWYSKNAIFGKALIDYSLETHGLVTKYTQSLIIHSLLDNIIYELPENIAHLVDIPSILDDISELLLYVDDDAIKNAVTLSKWFKCYLLKLKHQTVSLKKSGSLLDFYIGDSKYESFEPNLFLTAINEKNNCLYVSGYYNLASYDDIELIVIYNGQAYPITETENRYKNIYFFGEVAHKAKVIDLKIPLSTEGTVCFYMKVKNDADYPVRLVFPEKSGNDLHKQKFFIGDNTMIFSTSIINELLLVFLSYERLHQSINLCAKKIENNEDYKSDYHIMMEYLNMYPIMSKSKIWLFFDEPKSVGENTETLFCYSSKKKDGIEKYFIIDKNTLDAVRLEDEGTVVQYGSDMHKLLYLYAEKIIASNVLDKSYNPFKESEFSQIYNSIVKSELIYLPKEPQLEDISSKLNRFTQNIKLFAVSSEIEQQNILSNAYGYTKEIVQAIGLPKYDKLIGKGQNKIIFMPSWREKLYLGENKLNYDFINSEYCKKISELLCDERLLDVMLEYEYEMCFVPHTKTYLHISDFDMYENVNVLSPTTPRQQLFTSGALLITDRMPVYEFVYMKKPVIYYRFAEDDAGNVDSFENFMKFGETVYDNNTLVVKIIEYIKNSCFMPEDYVQRVNEYFKYTDNKNSERIYEILKNSR